MRRVTGSVALVALTLLGGCAGGPPAGSGPVATRSPVVPCTTTDLALVTVSKCGSGGLKFGVATE